MSSPSEDGTTVSFAIRTILSLTKARSARSERQYTSGPHLSTEKILRRCQHYCSSSMGSPMRCEAIMAHTSIWAIAHQPCDSLHPRLIPITRHCRFNAFPQSPYPLHTPHFARPSGILLFPRRHHFRRRRPLQSFDSEQRLLLHEPSMSFQRPLPSRLSRNRLSVRARNMHRSDVAERRLPEFLS